MIKAPSPPATAARAKARMKSTRAALRAGRCRGHRRAAGGSIHQDGGVNAQPSETSEVGPAWRPRWAVAAAWLIVSASSLAVVASLVAVAAALSNPDSWQDVLLVIFGSLALAGALIAAPAITFIVRGGRPWFYSAVSAVAAIVAFAAISVWQ